MMHARVVSTAVKFNACNAYSDGTSKWYSLTQGRRTAGWPRRTEYRYAVSFFGIEIGYRYWRSISGTDIECDFLNGEISLLGRMHG
jgi:hypothetical protein